MKQEFDMPVHLSNMVEQNRKLLKKITVRPIRSIIRIIITTIICLKIYYITIMELITTHQHFYIQIGISNTKKKTTKKKD